MKQLKKPFSDFWYGKDLVTKPSTSNETNRPDSEDDQYYQLKQAIQQEAERKWKQQG